VLLPTPHIAEFRPSPREIQTLPFIIRLFLFYFYFTFYFTLFYFFFFFFFFGRVLGSLVRASAAPAPCPIGLPARCQKGPKDARGGL